MSVTTEASLENVSVLFDQRFSTNCLASSGLVDAGWLIEYITSWDLYKVVTPSGRRLCFQRFLLDDDTVLSHYVCHPQLPYVDPV